MSARIAQAAYGRYVIIRDRDGVRHAVARGSISVLREGEDGGTILLLTGGRMVAVPDGLEATLAQIE